MPNIDNTHNWFRARFEKFLQGSHITLNGTNAWDMQVYNSNLYERLLYQGYIGLGEAYMEGWWDCQQLDELFYRFCSAQVKNRIPFDPLSIIFRLWASMANRQSKQYASQRVNHHYDKGNDLYRAMLDAQLTYSCGYWPQASTLDQAQEHKFDLICRKLNLQSGQRILDIGCGWGSFMKYAAEKYKVTCVGITLSTEQISLCQNLCAHLPIEIRFADYRELNENFDHIVSIGMFEHVGYKNYAAYMQVVNRCLSNDGLFLLHTIGSNTSVISVDPWMEKYIFPGGMLPSIQQIGKAIKGKFIMEDWHNFGADYDKTLMCWFDNFSAHWPTLSNQCDEQFFRMWQYYLLSCAGAFRARGNQLWQIVLSKKGVRGGYISIR